MALKINTANRKAEILIYEQIGKEWWSDDGIGSKEFADELAAAGELDEIKLYLNSPGGDVFEGLAIYNTLNRHAARKIVEIDGLAASITSIIAMVGDEIRIAANAMIMIHDPWTFAIGSSTEFRKQAEVLDSIADQLVVTYAARSGEDRKKIKDWMAEETWFGGEQAVELGFADAVIPAKSVQACFDKRWFKNAPKDFGVDGKRSKAPPAHWRLSAAKRHLDLMRRSA